MPKKAKIFLAVGDPDIMNMGKLWMQIHNHRVVFEASSLEEALERVNQAVKEKGGLIRKKEVNIAVIDGDLGTDHNDGPQIAQALREAIPRIKIVSFSSKPVNWGDVNLIKLADISNLGKLVTEL